MTSIASVRNKHSAMPMMRMGCVIVSCALQISTHLGSQSVCVDASTLFSVINVRSQALLAITERTCESLGAH